MPQTTKHEADAGQSPLPASGVAPVAADTHARADVAAGAMPNGGTMLAVDVMMGEGQPRPGPPPTITVQALVELVAGLYLAREGEELTQALAFERARQVACCLAGRVVLP